MSNVRLDVRNFDFAQTAKRLFFQNCYDVGVSHGSTRLSSFGLSLTAQ